MDINILKTQDAITTFDRARVAWAGATTDPSSHRRKDLRDKVRAVIDFFVWVNKPVQVITPGDIKKWQEELELSSSISELPELTANPLP